VGRFSAPISRPRGATTELGQSVRAPVVRCWWDVVREHRSMRVADCSPRSGRLPPPIWNAGMALAAADRVEVVGGHRDLSADGQQGKTVAVTDGERSPGATPCEAAADHRFAASPRAGRRTGSALICAGVGAVPVP
jgi:hypothetical protein